MSFDVKWAAGVYEGEGSAGLYGKAQRTMLCVTSTDEDVLETLRGLFGVGYISQTHARPGHRVCFRWAVTRREDALVVAQSIRPYMHARRGAQLDSFIESVRAKLKRRGPHAAWREPARGHTPA